MERVADRSLAETQARFWGRVEKTSGCWRWRGSTRRGYGRFKIHGRCYAAHRLAYEWAVGPIPAGLTIDHVKDRGCEHRDCVNPAHLEAVTMRENLMRGDSPSARASRVTHCPHGHPYAGENLTIKPGGARICRTCARAGRRRYRQSRRGRAE